MNDGKLKWIQQVVIKRNEWTVEMEQPHYGLQTQDCG
jgi:hypothetical protein